MTDADALIMAHRQVDKPTRELTPRQRLARHLFRGLANDMSAGSVAEQHTAALLSLCADAVEHGYESQLVALAGAWRHGLELAETLRQEGFGPGQSDGLRPLKHDQERDAEERRADDVEGHMRRMRGDGGEWT